MSKVMKFTSVPALALATLLPIAAAAAVRCTVSISCPIGGGGCTTTVTCSYTPN